MDQAAKGAEALQAGRHAEAIQHYDAAISSNPNAADYYVKRSTAYQRLAPADYSSALKDAEVAVVLAVKRAKRELIAQAQFRRAIALYGLGRYADAGAMFAVVRKLNEKERGLDIWEKKVRDKLEAIPVEDEARSATVKEVPDVTVPSPEAVKSKAAETSPTKAVDALEKPKEPVVPQPTTVKQDWYQSGDKVYFSLLVKGLKKEDVTIDIEERSISISFPTHLGKTYDLTLDPLYAAVDPAQSTSSVTASKVEIALKKKVPGTKWHAMEGVSVDDGADKAESGPAEATNKSSTTIAPANDHAPSYPTSSRSGPKDWDKVASELTTKKKKENGEEGEEVEDEDDEGDPANAFFKKLYAGADPDTRRAMIKSYQESNGTALSTNWSEVSKAPVETSPPDGMVAKKWGE